MKAIKKIGVSVALLALGMVLGALLFGPTDMVQGQDLANRFAVTLPKTPPSPCNLMVHSRIVAAEDGTATASLIAYPPSPCTSLNLEIVSIPDDSASCMESAVRGRVTKVDCEFDADHVSTDFNFRPGVIDP